MKKGEALQCYSRRLFLLRPSHASFRLLRSPCSFRGPAKRYQTLFLSSRAAPSEYINYQQLSASTAFLAIAIYGPPKQQKVEAISCGIAREWAGFLQPHDKMYSTAVLGVRVVMTPTDSSLTNCGATAYAFLVLRDFAVHLLTYAGETVGF